MTYDDLDELLVRTKQAFESGQIAYDIINDTLDVAELLDEEMPGFAGCFGVGYPYYALDTRGNVIKTPTISSFLDEFRAAHTVPARLATAKTAQVWPCPDCQECGGIPNELATIQTFCNPCEVSLVKPRSYFRALPDQDIFLIYDEVNEDVEAEISRLLKTRLGLDYCEANMRDSIDTLQRYFKGDPSAKLPIDLHLITTGDFYRVCAEMSMDPNCLPDVHARANYLKWHDRPIEVRRDFLFSMTPVGPMRLELQYTFNTVMRDLARVNDFHELEETLHERMKHILRGSPEFTLICNFINRLKTMKGLGIRHIKRMPWEKQHKSA